MFAEPFKNALVYINAFLIAITKIIRAFKPVKTESETAGAGMQQFADDTEDAVDASTGGGNLDFDEFRVLGGGENEQISITEAITAELQKQIDAYNEQLAQMNEINNKAIEIAEKIRDWFIVTDDEGLFVEWTDNAKLLGAVLIALPIVSTIAKLNALSNANTKVAGSLGLILKAFNLIKGNPVILAIIAIIGLLAVLYIKNEQFRESVNKLFEALKPLLTFVADLLSMILDLLNPLLDILGAVLIPVVDNLTKALQGFTVILALISYFIEFNIKITQTWIQLLKDLLSFNWGQIGENINNIWSDWSSNDLWQTATGNIINTPGKLKIRRVGSLGFAEGGITDANFIMTHENGVREWVGRQENSTAVVNDTQMSDVMGQAVRNGVLEALSYGTGGNENINITVEARLDGQKIYESTRRIARKNGEKFAKV